jgi:MSHA biogenesis protein MshI
LRVRDLPFLARRTRCCAGIYLSASTVAVAAAEPGADRLRVSSAPLTESTSRGAALKALVQRLGAERARCVVVPAPEAYQLILIERPSVGAHELRDAVRWRIQEYLDFPAADAVVDVFPFPDAATRGRSAMVFVVASARARIELAVREAIDAGLTPACVDIAELSLRNLVHRIYPSPEHAIGLLRMTPASGVVNITRGDELFLSRRVSNVPSELGDRAWDAFKDGLLLQVQRSIDYYESALSQPPADCLLVASTHGWQSRIVEHLGSMLPLPVRSLVEVLVDALSIDLVDGSSPLEAAALTDAQQETLAAALPALGAALRATMLAEAAA